MKPFLVKQNLNVLAEIAVNAAEAEWRRSNGEKKLQAALDRMKDNGYDVNSQTVIDAIKAAWYKLNLEMIGSGEKKPDTE